MAVVNYELREVLDNLNNYLNGKINKLYRSNNYFIVKSDCNDDDQGPLADDVPQSLVPKESGDGSDPLGQVESSTFDNEFYPDDCGFYPYTSGFYVDSSGLYYPYNYELYPENGELYPDCSASYPGNGGSSATYYSDESGSTGGGVQLPKKENKAIDIVNPETGEKLQF